MQNFEYNFNVNGTALSFKTAWFFQKKVTIIWRSDVKSAVKRG